MKVDSWSPNGILNSVPLSSSYLELCFQMPDFLSLLSFFLGCGVGLGEEDTPGGKDLSNLFRCVLSLSLSLSLPPLAIN